MGLHNAKIDLQRPPDQAFPIPKTGRPKTPPKVDLLRLSIDMQFPKMSPKMAFKTSLHKLALDCHKSTSQIGGGGGDPQRDCQFNRI